jgi:hypothetical protein
MPFEKLMFTREQHEQWKKEIAEQKKTMPNKSQESAM